MAILLPAGSIELKHLV